tara:strand:+ start:105 stop:560 length:456 start_codon:yes stop_codon:yes gene_type:complete
MKKYTKHPHLSNKDREEYMKQYYREYYLKHREKKLRQAKENREKNKESIKEYQKQVWKNTSIEDRKEKAKKHREMYSERVQEYKTLLGGKCVVCGTTERLEFDHIDPKNKLFNITRYATGGKPKDVFMEELKKCQLLCYSCHKNKTFKNGG